MDAIELPKPKQQFKIYGKRVTWKSPDKLIHACAGKMIASEIPSYALWTFCGIDVTDRFSFELIKARDVTCHHCLSQLLLAP